MGECQTSYRIVPFIHALLYPAPPALLAKPKWLRVCTTPRQALTNSNTIFAAARTLRQAHLVLKARRLYCPAQKTKRAGSAELDKTTTDRSLWLVQERGTYVFIRRSFVCVRLISLSLLPQSRSSEARARSYR